MRAIVCSALFGVLTSSLQQAAVPSIPVPSTPASIQRGKIGFLQNCAACHDEDGRARSSAIALAADLTRPESWKFSQTTAKVFLSIKKGAGDNMPPFEQDLKDDQIWDIINFIRSIGPQEGQEHNR
jgi:mono/diheme cytochrome c family protein